MRKKRGGAVKQIIIFLCALCVASCQSIPGEENAEKFRANTYLPILEKFTDNTSQYNGFHNQFEVHATLLNSKVIKTQVDLLGQYFQWDKVKQNDRLQSEDKKLSENTTVFISFFSPDTELSELTSKKTPINFYLESSGRRYDGKVVDAKHAGVELQKLYPYHNRWSKGYHLEFAIPATTVEKTPSTLTLTGPLGAKTISFSPNL